MPIQADGLVDALPLWALFMGTVLLVLVSVEGGYRLGKYRHQRSAQEKEAPVGMMVAATLGLLSFLLAFTFGLAAARFDDKRQVLINESNAIGTAYLRAGLLAEPHRSGVRALLREYVDIRLEGIAPDKLAAALRRTGELHSQLWAQAVAVGEQNPGSIMVGLFIHSLNEVIDLHSKRLMVGLRSRIPGVIWVVLYGVAVLAFTTMGYHAGLAETRRSLAVVAVALAFSWMMILIADINNPQTGWIKVSQQSMVELQGLMAEPQP